MTTDYKSHFLGRRGARNWLAVEEMLMVSVSGRGSGVIQGHKKPALEGAGG